MKKSNLLLLVGFLGIIVFISAIHITLYAKYKSGDYTIYNEEEDLAADAMHTFPNIAFVSVRNVPIADVRFSEVAQAEKGLDEDLQFTRKGDTLEISPKSGANYDRVRMQAIYLPGNVTLSLTNSSLSFSPATKATQINPVIYLNKSDVMFLAAEDIFRLGQVKIIAADSSSASFQGKINIASLDVNLAKSSIQFKDGDFNQLSIVTDSVSRISLQSKHLLKATIKTGPSQ